MPFKSQAQRRWMFSQHPGMAHRWAEHTPDIKKLPEKVDQTEAEDPEKVAGHLQRFAGQLFGRHKLASFAGSGSGQGFMGLRNFSAPMGLGSSGYIHRPAPPPLHNAADIKTPVTVRADVPGIQAAMAKLASADGPWYRRAISACVARSLGS